MSILLSDRESHSMKLSVHIYYSLAALTTNGSDIKFFCILFQPATVRPFISSQTESVSFATSRQVNASEHWKTRRHPVTLVPCK